MLETTQNMFFYHFFMVLAGLLIEFWEQKSGGAFIREGIYYRIYSRYISEKLTRFYIHTFKHTSR